MSYYDGCAFAKPKDKKKKPLYNGYKGKPERICMFTGAPYAERHEIFGGANRQNSIKYQLQVDLCPEIHNRVTNPKTDKDLELVAQLREMGQMKFEARCMANGDSPYNARVTFKEIFGKNYLPLLGIRGE